MSNQMTQVRTDGRKRTFTFKPLNDGGTALAIEIHNRDGQLVEASDFIFTESEFGQFCELAGRVAA
jgi:hypothetical protein